MGYIGYTYCLEHTSQPQVKTWESCGRHGDDSRTNLGHLNVPYHLPHH